jgi:hypothetical protein
MYPQTDRALQGPASAGAPFDDAWADLILRSSDGVPFRVFKIILSLASPIFTDMFSIPPPVSQQSDDQIPMVDLSEHSKVLDVALCHIYPIRSPDNHTSGPLPCKCLNGPAKSPSTLERLGSGEPWPALCPMRTPRAFGDRDRFARQARAPHTCIRLILIINIDDLTSDMGERGAQKQCCSTCKIG